MDRVTSEAVKLEERGGRTVLLCPRCGSGSLQHLGVAVYERADKAPFALQVSTRRSNVGIEMVDADQADNPSENGHGVALQLFCESCSGDEVQDIELTFAQEGAATLLAWRFPPRDL